MVVTLQVMSTGFKDVNLSSEKLCFFGQFGMTNGSKYYDREEARTGTIVAEFIHAKLAQNPKRN